jgi:CheY-like chemotaxis protein
LRAAFNADEALKVLTTFKPSLILMDIQLSGRSGLELTRELRANPEMNDASIVALTAYGGKEDQQSFLKAAATATSLTAAAFAAIREKELAEIGDAFKTGLTSEMTVSRPRLVKKAPAKPKTR